MRGVLLLESSKELHPSLVEVHAPFQEDYVRPVGPHAPPFVPAVACCGLCWFCFTLQQTSKAWAALCSEFLKHVEGFENMWILLTQEPNWPWEICSLRMSEHSFASSSLGRMPVHWGWLQKAVARTLVALLVAWEGAFRVTSVTSGEL